MKKHPFPKNGKEINREVMSTIDRISPDRKSVLKLFYNNLGIVSKIFSENNYDKLNATVEEFLSFYYESILVSIKDYDSSKGMSFHNYLYFRMRNIISNDYKYNGSVVHIPVMKVPDGEYETLQLTTDMTDHHSAFSITEEGIHKLDTILDDPFFIKKAKSSLSVDEYHFFSLWREYSLVDAAEKMKLTRGKFQRMSERIREKLATIVKTIESKENLIKKLTKKPR